MFSCKLSEVGCSLLERHVRLIDECWAGHSEAAGLLTRFLPDWRDGLLKSSGDIDLAQPLVVESIKTFAQASGFERLDIWLLQDVPDLFP